MSIAILSQQGEVFVQIPEDQFRALLKTYFERTHDIDAAMDQIEAELKQLTVVT